MEKITVCAYKSNKKEELYVFVDQTKGLDTLPAEFLVMFGETQFVTEFELTPTRRLGREDPAKVYEAIKSKGYFVQMPPNEIEKLSDMPPPPERLDNIY
ncbi:YcgL domain-containing protein [Thiomicrospira sp. R3]|uniref:YcgL domain-containing protein n=1 Tax=Thiomicrospira sp. R3 TaxID=3035472 RepID=UPI00259B0482|nr:YcgL domain-containing protein [Thiomicrospira sp. R3]WFE69736.1 YcgL domain-containing protein [Thiomicrospira sp. R3]